MTFIQPMLAAVLLFAEPARPPRKLDPINDIGIPLAALAGALLVLAIVLLIMKRWYVSNRSADEDGTSLLSGLRDAADEGDLTPEELKLIKARLAGGLGKNGKSEARVKARPKPKEPMIEEDDDDP